MATWIVGDIHGCADELARLLAALALGADDRLVALGDLFHRGPAAAGVMDLLRGAGARFVLGNHEDAVLRRVGLAPGRADAGDRPALRTSFPPLEADDLAGDKRRALHAPPERLPELLRFLQGHSGYFLEQAALPGAGPTKDGRPWCAVHAGTTPGREPRDSARGDLILPARASGAAARGGSRRTRGRR